MDSRARRGPERGSAARSRGELGIEPAIGRLLVADWWCDSPDRPDGQGGEKLLFVFDGGHLPPAQLDQVTVDGEEVIGYGFHPVTELAAVTTPRLANRITHARAARHDGTTRYLENGQPEPS